MLVNEAAISGFHPIKRIDDVPGPGHAYKSTFMSKYIPAASPNNSAAISLVMTIELGDVSAWLLSPFNNSNPNTLMPGNLELVFKHWIMIWSH